MIDSKAPNLIEGFDPDTPVYESPDDVPTLTQEEFEQMQSEGVINEIPAIRFGNPADLSYTETVIELYQDMEINTVSDQLFRLLLN